jgi:hypothetical protein
VFISNKIWTPVCLNRIQRMSHHPHLTLPIKRFAQGLKCGIWDSNSGGYEGSIFWNITPCNPLKFNRRFKGACCLHLQRWKVSHARNQCESRWQAGPGPGCHLLSLGKMDATYSSETSVDFQWNAQHSIPEDRTVEGLSCQKSFAL